MSKANTGKRFGVFIVNWNRSEVLDRSLQSILSQSRKPDEILVFDNASTDDSVKLLRKKYSKKVRVIAAPVNIGLCKATNICFNTLDCEYVGVVENDVVLTENWIEDCIRELDSDKGVAVTAPLFLHRVGEHWCDIELKPVKERLLPVCGGVFAIRKSFFEKAGQLLYDEDYFFHAQNFEMAARVLARQGKISRLFSSASFHYIGGKRAQSSLVKRMLMRNNLWNLWRFYSKRIVLAYTPIALAGYFAMIKNPIEYLADLFETIAGIPACLKNRTVVRNELFPEFVSLKEYFAFLGRLRSSNDVEKTSVRYCKGEHDFTGKPLGAGK